MMTRRRTFISALFLATILISGCAGSTGQSSASTISAVASVDASHDVRVAAEAWARAAVARDAAAMAGYFDEHAYAMYPQPQPTVGRSANHAVWAAVFSQPGVHHPVTVDSIVVAASGDLAYVMGRWRVIRPPTEHSATDIGGRYIAVWRPVGPGATWRIVTLSANALSPPPAMSTEG